MGSRESVCPHGAAVRACAWVPAYGCVCLCACACVRVLGRPCVHSRPLCVPLVSVRPLSALFVGCLCVLSRPCLCVHSRPCVCHTGGSVRPLSALCVAFKLPWCVCHTSCLARDFVLACGSRCAAWRRCASVRSTESVWFSMETVCCTETAWFSTESSRALNAEYGDGVLHGDRVVQYGELTRLECRARSCLNMERTDRVLQYRLHSRLCAYACGWRWAVCAFGCGNI